MPIRLENVGIAVRDIDATIAFFTDLDLTVPGRDTVSGEGPTRPSGSAATTKIAVRRRRTARGRSSSSNTGTPRRSMHRVAFSVDDLDAALKVAAKHGCHPLRGVATYRDAYRLTSLRGPSEILVMLARDLRKA
jgi:glyoxylase I family protein